jgi:hypothetical protein
VDPRDKRNIQNRKVQSKRVLGLMKYTHRLADHKKVTQWVVAVILVWFLSVIPDLFCCQNHLNLMGVSKFLYL